MAEINILIITNNSQIVAEIKNRTREYDDITQIKNFSEIFKKVRERLYDLVVFDEEYVEENLNEKFKEISKLENRIGYFVIIGNKLKSAQQEIIPSDCFLSFPIENIEFKALLS